MERASLIVIDNSTYRRAIVEHHRACRIGWERRRIRRPHDDDHGRRRIISREAGRWLGILPLEHGLFNFPQAAHLASHLDFDVTVSLQYGFGEVAEKMIVAVAMRHVRKLYRDPLHERVLLVRDPKHDLLAQGFGPLFGFGDQPLNLIVGCGDQGLGKPHPFLSEFPHHVKGLVSLLGLQPVDRKDDLIDRFVVASQGFGVLLTCGQHHLVTLNVLGDGIVRKLDPVVVQEFGLDVGNRHVARAPTMPDPAENVPANRPARWCDRGFLFGALGLGVPGAVTIGAMAELADQLHSAA